MTQLSKNNFYQLAKHFDPCSEFYEALEKCETTADLVQLIEDQDNTICEQLKPPRTVPVDFNYSDIIERLCGDPRATAHYEDELLHAMGCDDLKEHDSRLLTKNSVLNEMKLELFAEIIDDVSLGEVEKLYRKYRGSVVSNQMQMVI